MIVVHVPINESDAMRDTVGIAGGGKIGNYSFVVFLFRDLADHCQMIKRILQLELPVFSK